jgi:sugar O-acyltransferase (sialic acid O-acetyltransferase NeuD family)
MKCVVMGAGGHATVVASALLASGVTVIGFLDKAPASEPFAFRGLTVIGADDAMPELARDPDLRFVCGVGGVGSNATRRAAFLRAVASGLRPMTVVHPAAYVDPDAQIGDGSFIGVGAIVNAGCRLGVNVIINTGAIVEHHGRIGDHVHVATGAVLCGSVRLDDESHVGAGATIRQGLHVARAAVVGAGAVVIADVGEFEMVVGNPAAPAGKTRPSR